ncbi:HAD-IIIC family phosphatase [Mucilaginibacter sp. dw_454]|uniref:HAD-IIIC family phosphatase n=1 Tax=Mucilaginibacter sp. dw_454 TaxID=2720079 RepID=UPI001BD6DEAE|nr:HAD-IIIC family phosphatase [Mucilaginibacter sp. dw_454]
MKDFSALKKNLKRDFSQLKAIKIALLGDTATQFLQNALRGTGYDYGYDLQIFEADFNQIERQIFDPASELYEFAPEVIIIFQSTHKLLARYDKSAADAQATLAGTQLQLIDSLCTAIRSKISAKIIYYNYPEINDNVFGNYANKTAQSFLFQLRKLNFELMQYAANTANFYICDISSVQNQVGKLFMFQPSVYVNAEMVLSIDALPLVATATLDIIGALYGKFKKCLIIDLDNTMWGGIIGDDGLENIQIGSLGIGKAFTEFQYWMKKLKNRGIILAICSKNTESVAKEPFEKHPDMVLHLDDIAVFVANWKNKAENIKYIQRTLNIGFDSMVFLDDNPFERNIVRELIPDVTVPELPADPAEYLEYLYTLNLFETASYSEQDAERTKQYQTEIKRTVEQASHGSENDFLKSLNMLSLVEPFNKFNAPRVAQLSQRSNQFNLRTVRYTEADIEALAQSKNNYTLSFTLEDKFGDNGLICVIILHKENNETLFIDTWFMSCRVLKRGMEDFVLNSIVAIAGQNGFKYVKGEYIATAKNEMVRDHYLNLGFKPQDNLWILATEDYTDKEIFIKER